MRSRKAAVAVAISTKVATSMKEGGGRACIEPMTYRFDLSY
jgi:hypothetical protein